MNMEEVEIQSIIKDLSNELPEGFTYTFISKTHYTEISIFNQEGVLMAKYPPIGIYALIHGLQWAKRIAYQKKQNI